MKIKIGVVDQEVGVLLVKTSKEQVEKVGREEFKRKMERSLKVLFSEIEHAMEDGRTSYVEKTLIIGKKQLND